MYIPENINTNCGIYRIVNKTNGKFYIGSTKNAKDRKKTHFRELEKGVHACPPLQNAWNAVKDKSNFEFNMFIYCNEQDRFDIEQKCINIMLPHYNVCKIVKMPPDLTGYKQTPEHREKVSAAKKGKKLSPEHCLSIGRSKLGKPSWNKNKPWEQETKIKFSLAKKGKSAPKKSVLTENQAVEILQSMEGTLILAEKYGVSRQVIADLRMGNTWKHLPRIKVWTRDELRVLGWTEEKRKRQGDSVRGANHRDAKLTEADVLEIRASNARHVDLAKKYDVSACTILSIRQGATWKHLLPDNFFDSPAENQQPLDWPSKEISAESERFAHGDIL